MSEKEKRKSRILSAKKAGKNNLYYDFSLISEMLKIMHKYNIFLFFFQIAILKYKNTKLVSKL